MRKIAAAGMLALAGCASAPVPGPGIPTVPQTNLSACTHALWVAVLAAHTISPSKLLAVAEATPACIGLGLDILSRLVTDAKTKQAAQGVRE